MPRTPFTTAVVVALLFLAVQAQAQKGGNKQIQTGQQATDKAREAAQLRSEINETRAELRKEKAKKELNMQKVRSLERELSRDREKLQHMLRPESRHPRHDQEMNRGHGGGGHGRGGNGPGGGGR